MSKANEVLVLDSGEPGREASSAAAGMLAAADPETPQALRRLANASAQMFPKYMQKIGSRSGNAGRLSPPGRHRTAGRASAPPEYEQLSGSDLHQLEPSLKSHGHPAFFVQEDSVDPRLLMQAALAAARRLQLEKPGIEVRGHAAVKDMCARRRQSGSFIGSGQLHCALIYQLPGCMVRCAGKTTQRPDALHSAARPVFCSMCYARRTIYIVPRSSGKILIGATVEDVGFDKSVSSLDHQKTCAIRPQNICLSWLQRQSLKAGLGCVLEHPMTCLFSGRQTHRMCLLPAATFAMAFYLLRLQRP